MKISTLALVSSIVSLVQTGVNALSVQQRPGVSRRVAFMGIASAIAVAPALAAEPDCMTYCLKECKVLAPKDPGYCLDNCNAYCNEPDRGDGLETGILGTSSVTKGDDKPPQVSLPGLDFSSDKGRKLLGY